MTLLFWLSLLGATHSYLLYPALLLLLPHRRPKAPEGEVTAPRMSVIITARNEALRIGEKLHNTLAVDYPRDRLELIVASDSSDDDTDTIAQGLAERGVRLVRAEQRRGKEHAQSLAIAVARGEILVFSDVATRIPEDALRRIADAFTDPQVGALSSVDRFITPDGKIGGEGAYVRYEMWLRSLESRVNTLVGLSGSFFAARRAVCQDWDIRVPSDFNTALNAVRLGFVAISDPKVIGYYADIQDENKEYARKLRTVIRGLSAVFARPDVLNPSRFGFFAFQVWSHKIFRWLVPWFLLGLLISSLALAGQGWPYDLALAAQGTFYGLAVLGAFFSPLRNSLATKTPYFFIQVNLAIAHATVLFLMGKRMTVWEPSKR